MRLFRLSLAIACVAFVSAPAFAQTESHHISNFHSDFGIKLMKDGNLSQAADQFIQSILLAPSNKLAKRQLLNLAKRKDFESKSVKMQVFRSVELADYITFLKEKVEKLENENTQNIQFILGQTSEGDPLKENARTIEQQIDERKRLLIPQPDGIQEKGDRWSKLIKINQHFLSIKESLLIRFSMALAAYERLNIMKAQIVTSDNEKQRQALAGRYEGQLTAVKRQVVERDQMAKKQEKQIRLLQKDLTMARSDFEYLHSKIAATQEKIAGLTNKITQMALQSYEKDASLADKSEVVGKLQTNLNEVQQRWELVQKIIQEKDRQIKGLEEKMAGVASGLSTTAATNDERLKELKENLSLLQAKTEQQEVTNRTTIDALKQEFTSLENSYAELQKISVAKDARIGRLQSEIAIKNRKLTNVVGFFDAYDQDILYLHGVVEIYKGKLQEAQVHLTDKDQKLQNLEREVAEFKEGVKSELQSQRSGVDGDVLQETRFIKNNTSRWEPKRLSVLPGATNQLEGF